MVVGQDEGGGSECGEFCVAEAGRSPAAGAVRVIPNGINLAAVLGLPPRLAALSLCCHELVLAHPARLIRRKNIEFGLRVTAALRRAGLDAAYAVTGTGNEWPTRVVPPPT